MPPAPWLTCSLPKFGLPRFLPLLYFLQALFITFAFALHGRRSNWPLAQSGFRFSVEYPVYVLRNAGANDRATA